jgi:hypothetical protein
MSLFLKEVLKNVRKGRKIRWRKIKLRQQRFYKRISTSPDMEFRRKVQEASGSNN